MERFVSASLEELELLFVAGEHTRDIAGAAYPPGCDPRTGPLRFRPLSVGGLKVEVEPRDLHADDFRLAVLFHAGSCVFTDAADLARFFRGPVAEAFGVAAEPLPEKPAEELLADLRPVPQRRRRPASTPRRSVDDVPTAADLARRLAQAVHGQEDAVERIAGVVVAQLAKRAPARPETLLLIGPSGTGKTSSIAALPQALDDSGCQGAHVFRLDCNELTDEADVYRFLGAPPAYVGYTDTPALAEALRKPRCIVLLDEIEKADAAIRTALLGLLDEGRLSTPDGRSVQAPGAVVAMTSNLDAVGLAERLDGVPAHDRWRQHVCREHLRDAGWPPELTGRIGTFALFEPLAVEVERAVAESAIVALGLEYGLEIEGLHDVLVDVVLELAGASALGARAFAYASRDVLGQSFATASREGRTGPVFLEAGPPPRVVERCERLAG